MSKSKNDRGPQADGSDPASAQGFGTLDFRISMRDFFWAAEQLRIGGVQVGHNGAQPHANAAGSNGWPFDGVIARL